MDKKRSGKKMIRRIYFGLLFGMTLFLFVPGALSQEIENKSLHKKHSTDQPELGMDEKLGEIVPRDIILTDSSGEQYRFGDIVDKPTILLLIYYQCPVVCPTIQANLGSVITDVPHKLGADYQLISVSFDDEDTPKTGRAVKENFVRMIDGDITDRRWRFFTADAKNIHRLTNAVGFKFIKDGKHVFIHPNLITVLSGEGKVIRYLYGSEFLPFDIGMAVSEALKGTPGVSIKRILSYCFEYDPVKGRYGFRLLRIIGTVTLAVLGMVIFFLLKTPKRRQEL